MKYTKLASQYFTPIINYETSQEEKLGKWRDQHYKHFVQLTNIYANGNFLAGEGCGAHRIFYGWLMGGLWVVHIPCSVHKVLGYPHNRVGSGISVYIDFIYRFHIQIHMYIIT